MNTAVNWGILGAAKFAQEHMAPAIHAAKGARLAAIATRVPSRAEPFAAFCPDLRVHDSYDALLADPAIDAVYVPLPNTLHVEWAAKAMRAGKHVLVEKPIAMQADEIDPLIALRDETGLLAAEAYMIVHHPQWQRVRDLLSVGAIGQLMHVNGLFSYHNGDQPANIRNSAAMGGGGLPDIGVYTIGSARFATGQEPVSIDARIEWENGVDVKTEIWGQFEGFSYFAMISMRMQPYQEMLFHGSAGYIKVKTPFNARVFGEAQVKYCIGNGPVQVERWPSDNHYVHQVEAFCASVRTGAAYPWTLEDAKGTQAVIDRVFAAAGPAPAD